MRNDLVLTRYQPARYTSLLIFVANSRFPSTRSPTASVPTHPPYECITTITFLPLLTRSVMTSLTASALGWRVDTAEVVACSKAEIQRCTQV